ncbi:MAG: VanW family protein [Candidatus Beckwithbacteria bacterium]
MRSNLVKIGLVAVSSLLIIVSGILSLYHLAYNQKIYPYIFVGGTNLSNFSLAEAEVKLGQVTAELPKEMRLRFSNQEWPLSLNELEIKYEPKLTAEKIYLRGRSQGFIKDLKLKWQQWRAGANLEMELKLNEDKLRELVEVVVAGLVEEPIMPSLSLAADGKISLEPGKNGRIIDKEKLVQMILTKIKNLDFETVEIPVQLVQIQVSGEELTAAQERAEKIKTKSLKLKYENFSRTIKSEGIINLVGFKTEFDEEKIATLAASLGADLNRPAQNAVFQFKGERIVEFKPALPGLGVNEVMTAELIKKALINLTQNEATTEEVELVVQKTEPKISNKEVNDLGINELIGKGESTFFHSIPGRIHNVVLTANKLNGILIAPGEEFSFNRAVGDISAATGYKTAYIIKEGRTVLDDGGGVCQDSTTLFRAILDAGLKITERHAHAYRVSYYEQNSKPGFDATVYSPSSDLRFVNDTPGHILIQTTVDTAKLYLKFELYGTSDGRKVTISNIRLWDQSPPPEALYQDDPTLGPGQVQQVDWAAWGAKAAFDWQVTRNGEVLQKKTFYSNYAPWRAVYLRGI